MRREPALRSREAGIRSQEKGAAVLEIYRPGGRDGFRHDPDTTRRFPTMPGATAFIAGASEDRRPSQRAFERTGAGCTDLIALDENPDFHGALKHREQVGFRIYPDHDTG